jgi:hypothetical protein
MNYIWESLSILFIGFCLLRIAGKKTISEMSGLEIITILAIASTTGHAISETGLIKTILALRSLVILLIFIQFLTTKSKGLKSYLKHRDGSLKSYNASWTDPNCSGARYHPEYGSSCNYCLFWFNYSSFWCK